MSATDPTKSDSGNVRYTSHVTTMFTYQTPTSHALLGHQKHYYRFRVNE